LANPSQSLIGDTRRLKTDTAIKSFIRSQLSKAEGRPNPPPIDLTFIVKYTERNGASAGSLTVPLPGSFALYERSGQQWKLKGRSGCTQGVRVQVRG
jgi:hypothetical protein